MKALASYDGCAKEKAYLPQMGGVQTADALATRSPHGAGVVTLVGQVATAWNVGVTHAQRVTDFMEQNLQISDKVAAQPDQGCAPRIG